ncbi:MAG: hypothetical protein IJU98_05320 [Synergistaceae bacterium]|nr:hypothetical protein [Synergistaceae bacterium]
MRKFFVAVALVLLSCAAALAATPEVWYSTDGRTVWRETRKGREKTDLDPMFVEDAEYHPDSELNWVEADSAVWVCETNRKRALIRVPLREGETCRYAAVNHTRSLVFLSLVYNNDETLALFDAKGRRLAETPGVMGLGNGDSLFWIDKYRFLFTSSVHGTKRGPEENNWHGAAVFEIFGEPGSNYFETLVTPLVEPTVTVDYEAGGIDGDTGECVVLKFTVQSPEDWSQQEPVFEMEDIRVPVPAAG